MNADEFVSFEEMLTDDQREQLGISADRDLQQCIVRLASGYRKAESDLARVTAERDEARAEVGLYYGYLKIADSDLAAARADADRLRDRKRMVAEEVL